jgi:shikimate dehydrogenase
MRKYGLIGYPLGHSFSKKYFTEKFLAGHITNCSYDNYPLESLDSFPDLIAADNELCGLNITIPYKSEIIKFLDVIDIEAEEIGAVNVVKILRSGRHISLSGFNSDITGIRDSLLPYIGENTAEALVLGTGGSSRAVCYVLKKAGVKVNLVSRDRKPGTILYTEISSAILENTCLIINTTPLGMYPDIESKPEIDYARLTDRHILFDLVYNPELTSFLRIGKEQGCVVISGLRMLYSQAEKAWEIWNNDDL